LEKYFGRKEIFSPERRRGNPLKKKSPSTIQKGGGETEVKKKAAKKAEAPFVKQFLLPAKNLGKKEKKRPLLMPQRGMREERGFRLKAKLGLAGDVILFS